MCVYGMRARVEHVLLHHAWAALYVLWCMLLCQLCDIALYYCTVPCVELHRTLSFIHVVLICRLVGYAGQRSIHNYFADVHDDQLCM